MSLNASLSLSTVNIPDTLSGSVEKTAQQASPLEDISDNNSFATLQSHICSGPANREPVAILGKSADTESSNTPVHNEQSLLSKSEENSTDDPLFDDFMDALEITLDRVNTPDQKKKSACTKDNHSGETQNSRFNPSTSDRLSSSAGNTDKLLDFLEQLIENIRSNKNNDSVLPSSVPKEPSLTPPISGGENSNILTNVIQGGTGEPQRDMDPNKSGTQINVVLDPGMTKTDREQSLEALKRWTEVSGGELDFSVYDAGQQPAGQDYTLMRSVPADNTHVAGVGDVGRSPDGVTELQFESDSGLAVVMHEIGHTLGLTHSDGVLKAVNATTDFSETNLADLAALYPNMNA